MKTPLLCRIKFWVLVGGLGIGVMYPNYTKAQNYYWSEVGGISPVQDSADDIYCMYYDTYAHKLYVPFFEHATGKLVMAIWSGGSWQKFTSPDTLDTGPLTGGEVLAVTRDYNGNFYVGGSFKTGGNYNLIEWDGAHWFTLGGDTNNLYADGQIASLACDYNNYIYAGGAFYDNSG